MASNGVPGSRLNSPRKAVAPATGIRTIHAVVTKPGSNVSFKARVRKTTHIKGTHSGTTFKTKVQSSVDYYIGDKISAWSRVLPLPNVAT